MIKKYDLHKIVPFSAVIIIHYGSVEMTKRCINSVHTSTCSPTIILIDNNPLNPYPYHDNLIYYPQPINQGFAAGVNIGIEKAMVLSKKFVILINNDIELHPFAIYHLLKTVSNYRCMAGAVELALDKNNIKTSKIIFSRGTLSWREVAVKLHTDITEKNKEPYHSDFIRGSCMAFPLELVKAIGGMDEKYWAYGEDVDYCIRAAKAGWKLLIHPEAIVWHKVSGSFNPYKRNYLMARNYIYLLRQHIGTKERIRGFIMGFTAAFFSIFMPSRKGKWQGFWDGIIQKSPQD